MVNALFATTANISTGGGGDVVSLHESNALAKFCDNIHIISARDVPEETRRNPFAWDFYVSLLISRRYDIAHFNGHPFYRTINALKYYNPDIKIVTSVPAHNLEHSIEEHHKLGIDYEGLYPHMIGERFYEYASQEYMADAVVYPSKYSMDYLSQRLSLTNRQLVIPHGVDTPSKYPTYPSVPSVGYIGACGPDKGINYLLNAMKSLPRSNLTLYGKQTEGVKVNMSNVQTYGGYGNLDEIMSKISFGVFPSVTEGFNIPALECMAHGRPVIIADGAGFAEYVTDGVNGLVVPRCNVEVLVESIKYLIDNPDVVTKMGAKAYEFSKLLQWQSVEEEYVKLYTELFQ
jgi:glycosyltransferase involved in cell wall biosynthesis